jgi:hypothetical protein
MAGAGIQSFAKFRAQMCATECQGLKDGRAVCGVLRKI